jgi:hypothetical protein
MTATLPISRHDTLVVDGQAVTRGSIARDPLQIKLRLYIQIGEMLRQLEAGDDGEVSIRERIAALTAIGRLQNLLVDKGKDDDDTAGSAVRKYEGAFKNGTGKRKTVARSTAVKPEPTGWDDGDDADRDDPF